MTIYGEGIFGVVGNIYVVLIVETFWCIDPNDYGNLHLQDSNLCPDDHY